MGIEIDRRPFLMRPVSALHLLDEVHSPGKDGVESSTGRQRPPLYKPGEGLRIEPASNRSSSTHDVHAATAIAKDSGLDSQFFRVASKEYWEHGTDIGNLYTLRRVTRSIGSDWDDLWPKLESRVYHDQVLAQHQQAKAAGVIQTPTFQINGKMYLGKMAAEDIRAAVQADRESKLRPA